MPVATRASVLLLGVLLLVQLGSSRPSWAWTLDGHRLIAMDALATLPSPMREALTPHLSMLLGGVVEPDFNRVVSHKIQIISAARPNQPRAGHLTSSNGSPQALKRCFASDEPWTKCSLY
jgi:hypothetical protein